MMLYYTMMTIISAVWSVVLDCELQILQKRLVESCFEILYTSVFMWCRIGKVTVSHVGSGEYEVQDVRCCKCSISLGWTYLKAFNQALHTCVSVNVWWSQLCNSRALVCCGV